MDPRSLSDEKLAAILRFFVTVGYIDGAFDPTEKNFIAAYMERLSALVEKTARDPGRRAEIQAWVRRVLDGAWKRTTDEIESFSDDRPRDESNGESYLFSRLKVRCIELFRAFPPDEQKELLVLLDSFFLADGRVAPEEKKLREQLVGLLSTPPPAAAPTTPGTRTMRVSPIVHIQPQGEDHPFLQLLEHPFSPHPVELHSQLSREHALLGNVLGLWQKQRARGAGRLRGVQRVTDLPHGSSFLDGHVYVQRVDPIRPMEIIVIGDLHGCYSCLKGALLQTDFLRRVWLHQWNPVHYPDVKLVFLGDYLDRGRFSLDGVLRVVLNLALAIPDHVFVLRGNHEWFVQTPLGVRSGVYPAEAAASLIPHAPPEMLEAYRIFFEQMPTSFLTERTMIVHGGIPRDDTFQRYVDLSSLSDPELRFQMMWSDPAQAEHIPLEVQRGNPRFSFGRQQFRAFMERTGFQVMIRGHEKIDEGFKVVFDLGDRLLMNLFSAGGATNVDLPPESSYRKVTPMALTLMCTADREEAYPWPIDWQTFNAPARNGYLRGLPALEFRSV